MSFKKKKKKTKEYCSIKRENACLIRDFLYCCLSVVEICWLKSIVEIHVVAFKY